MSGAAGAARLGRSQAKAAGPGASCTAPFM